MILRYQLNSANYKLSFFNRCCQAQAKLSCIYISALVSHPQSPIKGGVLTKTFENYLCTNINVICNHFGAYHPWRHNHCHQVSLDPPPPLTWLRYMCTVPNSNYSHYSFIKSNNQICISSYRCFVFLRLFKSTLNVTKSWPSCSIWKLTYLSIFYVVFILKMKIKANLELEAKILKDRCILVKTDWTPCTLRNVITLC